MEHDGDSDSDLDIFEDLDSGARNKGKGKGKAIDRGKKDKGKSKAKEVRRPCIAYPTLHIHETHPLYSEQQPYAWEASYTRSWDTVQEDEAGSLQGAVEDLIARGRRRRYA